MQCPDCGYISFRQAKECGSCGYSFKKAAAPPASLFRNDSFTIFATPKTSPTEQETSDQARDDVAVIESPEESQEIPSLESGEFLLNLSDAEKEATTLESSTSKSEAEELTAIEFASGVDINLEEMEVEGLGLGLESMEEEIPATPEPESLEIPVEISEERQVADVVLEDSSSDSPTEITIEEEPVLEITPALPPEEDELTIEIKGLDDFSMDEDISLEKTEAEMEPVAPVLDLGDGEISLDLDESPEPISPAQEPSPVESDELKLELDDSEGPLTTKDDEALEIEIEDLGLELEDSEPPPDPEKP